MCLPPVSLSPGWDETSLCLSKRLSQISGRSVSLSYKTTAFCMGPSAHKILCVPLKSEVFISLSPVGLLQLSSIDLQRQMLWELIFPVPDPWAGDPNMGLRTLSPMGQPLQYTYYPVCGLLHWGLWDLVRSQACPIYLSPCDSCVSSVVDALCY